MSKHQYRVVARFCDDEPWVCGTHSSARKCLEDLRKMMARVANKKNLVGLGIETVKEGERDEDL